jgi:hypothetical protein
MISPGAMRLCGTVRKTMRKMRDRLHLAPVAAEYLKAALYCLAASVLFFRGPLLLRRYYHIPYDLDGYDLPLFGLIGDSLRDYHQLPWWNPYSYMGHPFFGNVQAAMFYPATVPTVLLANAVSGRVTLWFVEVLLVAHVAWAGLGAYVLLRKLRAGHRAAVAGAMVFCLGAFFASQIQHCGTICAAAWVPWFFAALHRLEERTDWRSVALAALPLALMILAGLPAAWLPALFFGPFLYLYWSWQRRGVIDFRAHQRPLALLAAAMALGFLLSAVCWLPGSQVVSRSIAAWRFPAEAFGGLPLEALTSLVWPNLFCQLHGDYWHPENFAFMHLYQGIPALLLVFGALGWLAASPAARSFLASGSIALLWYFGPSFVVSHLLYLLFPGSVRRGLYAWTALAYFSLCFAVLAGLSLEAWQRGERKELFPARFCRRAALLALALGLIVCLAGVGAPSGSPLGQRGAHAGATLTLVAAVLALCAWIASLASGRPAASRPRLVAAVGLLIVADLVAIGSHTRLNTGDGPGNLRPKEVDWLLSRLGPRPLYRIDTTDAGGQWQTKVAQWRLPSANGMDPLLLQDVVRYRTQYSRLDYRQFVVEAPASPLLDLSGARYLVTWAKEIPGWEAVYRGEFNIFENRRAFPRYFLVGGTVTARDVSEAARKINTREADPALVAVVPESEARLLGEPGSPASSEQLGRVELLAWSPNEFRLRTSAARSAILVVTETYWPDWRVTVDGEARPLVRADGIFRAVAVPPGVHQVRMYIVPRRLYLGAAASLAGVLLAALCLFTAFSPAHSGG